MNFKETLKSSFNKDDMIVIERYKASKFIFIISAFIFFIVFYFVWAWFYSEYLLSFLGVFYIFLIFSLSIYLYFLFKKYLIWKVPKFVFYIYIFLLLIFFIFLIAPVSLNWWVNWALEYFNLSL